MQHIRERLKQIQQSDSSEAKAIAEFVEDFLESAEYDAPDDESCLSGLDSSLEEMEGWIASLRKAVAADLQVTRS